MKKNNARKRKSGLQSMLEEGNRAMELKEYARAIAKFNGALKGSPQKRCDNIFFQRSIARRKEQDFDGAIEDAQEARRLKPGFTEYTLNLADACLEAGKRVQAAQVLREGLLQWSEHPKLLELLCKCENEQGEFVENCIDWLAKNGALLDTLSPLILPTHQRRLLAGTQIEKNDCVLYVPAGLLLTLSEAAATPLGRLLKTKKLKLFSPQHSVMAFLLHMEASKGCSQRMPYLTLLPRKYQQFPVCYPPEDLQLLAGSPVLSKVQQMKNELQEDYSQITQNVPEFNTCSFEEFTRLRLFISSRCCELTIRGVWNLALVPLFDFAEHAEENNCSWWFDDEYDGFLMMANKQIDANSPLTVNYGKKSNEQLLLHHGFALENNSEDSYALTVQVESDLPLVEEKKKLFCGSSRTIKLQCTLSSLHLFTALARVVVTHDAKDLPHSATKVVGAKRFWLVSKTNEAAALQVILNLVEHSIAQYPASIEEVSEDLSTNARNCFTVVSEEKRILEWHRSFARSGLAVLNGDPLPEVPDAFKEYLEIIQALF